METQPNTPSWDQIRQRWLVYAQRATAQWPEIAFDDLAASGGSRILLTRLVADTYGLDIDAADRAVTLWRQRLSETDASPLGSTAA